MTKKGVHLGKTILATFSGCKYFPDTVKEMERIAQEAVRQAGATIRDVGVFEHEFSPHGITVGIVLGESHAVGDTWPELNIVTFDIFTCGDKADPEKAVKHLKDIFCPRKIDCVTISRQGFVYT